LRAAAPAFACRSSARFCAAVDFLRGARQSAGVSSLPAASADESAPLPLPSREELPGAVVRRLSQGGARNSDVLLVNYRGHRLVVKDFTPRSALVRATLGRWITAREARAWRALAGHPSVPRFAGCIDALALVSEYCEGQVPPRRPPLPPAFHRRLRGALDEMHRRGVAHLDLRHLGNVLVDAAGEPVLVDFGAAVVLRPGGLLARLLMPILAAIDRRMARKWQRAEAPLSS